MSRSAAAIAQSQAEIRSAPPSFRLGHRPELNGLRGFAVVSVMLYHADEHFLKAGFIGVDFFFVLSGFLITALLIGEFDAAAAISLKRFYARRALRLAPALLLLLTVYCIATPLLFGFPKTYSYWADALIVLLYSANWARAFNLHGPYHLGHAWSLSIEEQFYALWPSILALLLRKTRARWMIAGAASLVALGALALRNLLMRGGSTDMRIYNGLDTRADALMVGSCLGILVASGIIPSQVRGAASRAVLLAAGLLSFIALARLTDGPTWNDPAMFHWIYFAIEVLTAVVILDCVINPSSVVKRILGFRPLVWIGTISYGLYLWHYPIYVMLRDAHFGPWQVLALGSTAAFAVATASFYFLEQPFLRMKKKFGAAGSV